MNRHLALTFAGATAIFVTAASGAVAANVGILNVGAAKPVGKLSAANVSQLATPTGLRAAAASSVSGPATPSAVGDPSTPAEGSQAAVSSAPGVSGSTAVPTAPVSGSSTVNALSIPGGSSIGSTSPAPNMPTAPSPTTTQVTVPPTTTTRVTVSPPTTSRSQGHGREDHEDEGDDD